MACPVDPNHPVRFVFNTANPPKREMYCFGCEVYRDTCAQVSSAFRCGQEKGHTDNHVSEDGNHTWSNENGPPGP